MRARPVATEGQQNVEELQVIFVDDLLGRAAESGEQLLLMTQNSHQFAHGTHHRKDP